MGIQDNIEREESQRKMMEKRRRGRRGNTRGRDSVDALFLLFDGEEDGEVSLSIGLTRLGDDIAWIVRLAHDGGEDATLTCIREHLGEANDGYGAKDKFEETG